MNDGRAPRLAPYALAFCGSLCLMVLELVAGRLVASHVGASLVVWTSVIGIMLGGICLGNVLGGRLADRAEPSRVIGPLYGMAGALTLGSLWANAAIGLVPGLAALPWNLGTIAVVTLDFLAPATVLGMLSPILAKMAVSQSIRAGGALGDVSSWGAIGSIAGTFLAGFVLIYEAPTSTIVTVVAAALALLGGSASTDRWGRFLALATGLALAFGSAITMASLSNRGLAGWVFQLGSIRADPLTLLGHALALALAAWSIARLRSEVAGSRRAAEQEEGEERVKLADLAGLAFLSSLVFMALEMVAGRFVTRHLGSSVFGWTSIIGVLLGGLSLGNLIGGRFADVLKREGQASHFFLIGSVLTLIILKLESPPHWLVFNPVEYLRGGAPKHLTAGGPLLEVALDMPGYSWPLRVLIVVTVMFFPAALAIGTIGPVLAKFAVDRVGSGRRTGRAIGQVYAWGMVGSLLGTFLTGFVLIDVLGTKGVTLALATTLALAATLLGTAWHGAWAGLPLGLCMVAFLPFGFLRAQAVSWGLRDEVGQPDRSDYGVAYQDESQYYYIKISNVPKRDPDRPEGPAARMRTLVLDSLIHGHYMIGHPEILEYDYEFIYAQATRRLAQARLKAPGGWKPFRTMFIGGGSYTFPRYLQAVYPGTAADVAEIDPAVTEANHLALGLPRDTPIKTTWGDARQFIARRARAGTTRYDLIFGDAFNDFSVPWHLTTREFNDKVSALLAPDGVYMINIIDVYLSDEQAAQEGKSRAEARATGAFLGSWLKTARLTFPHLYVFGTHDTPGIGIRETFVVVASKAPIDLADLGRRVDDPRFFQDATPFERSPYGQEDLDALEIRSRGITLTDDYAPVEDLLAPVARTRANSEGE